MESLHTVPTQREPLEVIRRQRAALHEAIMGLETALATAAAGREETWRPAVAAAMLDLHEAFDDHVAATEGPDGLYAAITHEHERLVNPVRRLAAEHVEISNDLADLDQMIARGDPAEGVRAVATTLIARFSRHRQRGADLVYEAYDVDIGGE